MLCYRYSSVGKMQENLTQQLFSPHKDVNSNYFISFAYFFFLTTSFRTFVQATFIALFFCRFHWLWNFPLHFLLINLMPRINTAGMTLPGHTLLSLCHTGLDRVVQLTYQHRSTWTGADLLNRTWSFDLWPSPWTTPQAPLDLVNSLSVSPLRRRGCRSD